MTRKLTARTETAETRLEESSASQETAPPRRAATRLRDIDPRALLLPFVLAAVLGVLEMWGTAGTGYVSGWGDHFVLSTEGIRWADPSAFANDWFMEVAPQPHWFFDILTFVGQSLGMLSLVYVLFWACGLLAFGFATAMLAYRFTPASPWAIALGVTVVTAVTPWAIGGTGSPVIAQALPAVLSGCLIYLLIAGMLVERRGLVIVLAPVIAIVHVQQGSIALVLLVAMLLVETIRIRKVDWWLVGAIALTGAFTAFGLILRPVASNLKDFVRICDEVIPYHCAAHLWGTQEIMSTIGLIILSGLSVFVIPKSSRWIWYSTVGLSLLGYTAGFASDALRIPVLGTLAQGVNVYRLGAVILPFAVWGAFAPLLARLRGGRLVALIVVWFVGWVTFLLAPGWPTHVFSRVVLLSLAMVVVLGWFLLRTRREPDSAPPSGKAVFVAGMLVLVLTAIGGGLTLRVPDFTFIGDADLRTWGAQVRESVPSGNVIIAPPRFEWVKLVTERAVVADCKDVPYGGEAWDEWKQRLHDLGGYAQCVAPGPLLFDDLSAADLVSIADKYHSNSIVVSPAHPETVRALQALGWTHAVTPVDTSGADLMTRGR